MVYCRRQAAARVITAAPLQFLRRPAIATFSDGPVSTWLCYRVGWSHAACARDGPASQRVGAAVRASSLSVCHPLGKLRVALVGTSFEQARRFMFTHGIQVGSQRAERGDVVVGGKLTAGNQVPGRARLDPLPFAR